MTNVVHLPEGGSKRVRKEEGKSGEVVPFAWALAFRHYLILRGYALEGVEPGDNHPGFMDAFQKLMDLLGQPNNGALLKFTSWAELYMPRELKIKPSR